MHLAPGETATPRQRAARINGARTKHPTYFPARPRTAIADAIRRLLPGTRSHKAIEVLFDNKARYSQILHWRYGDVDPPEWARQLLTQKLKELGEICARLEAQESLPPK